MNSVIFDTNNAQKLLDLQIRWQKLIQDRNNAKPGTHERRELDIVYFKTLPAIVEIIGSVSDQEVERLIQLANSLLKQREGIDESKEG